MDLEIQVQPHLACFEILECNWNQDQEEGYIEVDFGEGKICGFHCHAKELSFALQHIQAFGERHQGLDQIDFENRMRDLYQRRLFCDLHKGDSQENYVAIYKFDDLRKNLECVGPRLKVPLTKMHRSRIEEEVRWDLQELAEMHRGI